MRCPDDFRGRYLEAGDGYCPHACCVGCYPQPESGEGAAVVIAKYMENGTLASAHTRIRKTSASSPRSGVSVGTGGIPFVLGVCLNVVMGGLSIQQMY